MHAHRAPSLGGWNGRDFVYEISSKHATGQLNMGAGRDDHVDITNDRVCLEGRVVRNGLGLRQVDRHVTEECDGDELFFNVPITRTFSVSPALENRLEPDQPTPTSPHGSIRLLECVVAHGTLLNYFVVRE
jgi:hypothetical protein